MYWCFTPASSFGPPIFFQSLAAQASWFHLIGYRCLARHQRQRVICNSKGKLRKVKFVNCRNLWSNQKRTCMSSACPNMGRASVASGDRKGGAVITSNLQKSSKTKYRQNHVLQSLQRRIHTLSGTDQCPCSWGQYSSFGCLNGIKRSILGIQTPTIFGMAPSAQLRSRTIVGCNDWVTTSEYYHYDKRWNILKYIHIIISILPKLKENEYQYQSISILSEVFQEKFRLSAPWSPRFVSVIPAVSLDSSMSGSCFWSAPLCPETSL